uniref:Endo/exonuclease/phosphatase domain-containing protein n=1 Tax=Strongyloides papillosus TaxID=174720 RepID=A0A0N5C3V9_STREA
MFSIILILLLSNAAKAPPLSSARTGNSRREVMPSRLRNIKSEAKVNMENNLVCVKMMTYNGRLIAKQGLLDRTIEEMKRLSTDILVITETKLRKNIHEEDTNSIVIMKKGHDTGFIIGSKLKNQVKNIYFSNERIGLNDTLAKLRKDKIVIMGDMNATFSKYDSCENILDKFCIDNETNENGEYILNLCQEYSLSLHQSFLRMRKSRKFTWTKAVSTEYIVQNKVIRKQLDYVITAQKIRKHIKTIYAISQWTFDPCCSDHRALIMEWYIPNSEQQNPKKWKKEKIKIFDEEKAKSLLLNFVDNLVHALNNNLN